MVLGQMRLLVGEDGGELLRGQRVHQAAGEHDAAMAARQRERERGPVRDQQHRVPGDDGAQPRRADLGQDRPARRRPAQQGPRGEDPHQHRPGQREHDQHGHRHRQLDRSAGGEGARCGDAALADVGGGAGEQLRPLREARQGRAEHHRRDGPHRQRAQQQCGGQTRRAHQHRGAPAHQLGAGQREGDQREGEQGEEVDAHDAPVVRSGAPPPSMSSRYRRSSAVSRSSMPRTKWRIEALRSSLLDSACSISRAACSGRGWRGR